MRSFRLLSKENLLFVLFAIFAGGQSLVAMDDNGNDSANDKFSFNEIISKYTSENFTNKLAKMGCDKGCTDIIFGLMRSLIDVRGDCIEETGKLYEEIGNLNEEIVKFKIDQIIKGSNTSYENPEIKETNFKRKIKNLENYHKKEGDNPKDLIKALKSTRLKETKPSNLTCEVIFGKEGETSEFDMSEFSTRSFSSCSNQKGMAAIVLVAALVGALIHHLYQRFQKKPAKKETLKLKKFA